MLSFSLLVQYISNRPSHSIVVCNRCQRINFL